VLERVLFSGEGDFDDKKDLSLLLPRFAPPLLLEKLQREGKALQDEHAKRNNGARFGFRFGENDCLVLLDENAKKLLKDIARKNKNK
jgi:hypothetical protein